MGAMMRRRSNAKHMGLSALLAGLGLYGCGDGSRDDDLAPPGAATSQGATTGMGAATTSPDEDQVESSGGSSRLDVGTSVDPTPQGCGGDSDCELVDVLFIIDNSGTMGEEQLNLARNFPRLVDRLRNLKGPDGEILNINVNIAVTTSDFDHPLCTPFQPEGYEPAQGEPVFSGCNTRLDAFQNLDPNNPVSIPEACTEACPNDLSPGGAPFIHFDAEGTNVPYNDVAGTLSCVGPQGINGCGYEAPLETMLHALRPDQCWNDPDRPGCEEDERWGWVTESFLREGSTLAIGIITDEADCSVASPSGYEFFVDDERKDYWAMNPESEQPEPSSATCWRGGVDCQDEDGDGVYEQCVSTTDRGVLHPVARYTQFLEFLKEEKNVEIVMLGVLGVPPVTKRMDAPPFAPIEGGVEALTYRDWRDGMYDGTPEGGDILPDEWAEGKRAEDKQFEFGIGPGCTRISEDGEYASQAVPPVRIRQVCESLNVTDASGEERIRCCIESICDEDFSPAIDCLTGIIAETINPVG